MTDDVLFSNAAPSMSIKLGQTDLIRARVWECFRCGAIVRDQNQHIAWHGAVDSNTTTRLARDVAHD